MNQATEDRGMGVHACGYQRIARARDSARRRHPATPARLKCTALSTCIWYAPCTP
jgi:hypothetical protein